MPYQTHTRDWCNASSHNSAYLIIQTDTCIAKVGGYYDNDYTKAGHMYMNGIYIPVYVHQ